MSLHVASAAFLRLWNEREAVPIELEDPEQAIIAAALGEPRRWAGTCDRDALDGLLNASPDSTNRIGAHLLSMAIMHRGCADAVRMLLERGIELDIDTSRGAYNVLHEAAWAGNVDELRAVFERGAGDITSIADPHVGWPTNVTLLYWAAWGGYPELATMLLEHGIAKLHDEPIKGNGERGTTPLHEALAPGPWPGAAPDALRSNRGKLEVADILLANDVPYDAYAACARNDAERLRTIQASDATVLLPDATHEFGMSPLHWAARAGAVDAARWLIEVCDAAVDGMTRTARSPLQLAAEENQASIIELLARHGANLDTQDKKGRTPLHRATYEGQVDAAEALLAVGADPTVKNKKGKHALEIARKGAKHLRHAST